MRKIFILAFLIITISNAAAQQVTFQKTYGGVNIDQGNSVQQTADSGYIITGWTNSFGAGNVDIYLVKTNSYGDVMWTKTFGDVYDDWGYSVKQTFDGGYIVAGYFGFSVTNTGAYLIKTDVSGNITWTKAYGSFGFKAFSVQQTIDSGYIVTGRTGSSGSSDVLLIKTNSSGDSLWTRSFGGALQDEGWSVQQTIDSGYIVGGLTYSFNSPQSDVYLIKTNWTGDTLWTKTYGGAFNCNAISIQQTTDTGFIIAGKIWVLGAPGTEAVCLIKTDANGNVLWTKTFWGTTNVDSGQSVQQTSDGGYIVAGIAQSFITGTAQNAYLIKTDENGDTLWTRVFYADQENYTAKSVMQTIDGGYIITGTTTIGNALFLIKTDTIGYSGCNEGLPPTNMGTAILQMNNPPTIVGGGGVITIPPTQSGSGGTVTTLCPTVGIQSAIPNSQSAITISPNPATNSFTVTFPGIIHNATVSIYNVVGETIFKENIVNTSRKEITLAGINAGIYFVKVIADACLPDRQGEQYTKKLVVQ